MGGPNPAVAQQASCPIGRRCHVSGKGIQNFAGKFTRAKVLDLASSSVQLVLSPKGGKSQSLASGTLVHDSVVLCAAHSIENQSESDLEVLLFSECSATTAPPGSRDQYDSSNVSVWKSCTILQTKPQGKITKALERGHSGDLDYALLAVEWTVFKPGPVSGSKIVELPRIPIIAQPSSTFTEHAILIAHPENEPTEASAGKVFKQFGPHPDLNKGLDYGYAGFSAITGSSGGGVFNESGKLIGVLKGAKAGLGTAFLNLGQVAASLPKSRIALWLSQGQLLKTGDPKENVAFKKV